MTAEDQVLERIRPGPEERRDLRELADRLMEAAEEEAAELGVEAEAVHVGSSSRGTWLSGDRDVDVFVKLPTSMDLEEFVETGMEIARSVGDRGDEWEENYAEHPYVKARFGSFDVDVVPCFDVDSPEEIRSAVDRTPFHDGYVAQRVSGLQDDVLLLKRFMKGTGVYSAEARVQGFSGYLAELLVLIHGGFREVVDAAEVWSPGERFDPAGHGTAERFDAPLVVVDPVDPDRNVAAALSLRRLAEFVRACRDYDGSTRFFFPPEPGPGPGFGKRSTYPCFVEVEVEGMVDDNLYPQLRKTRDALVRELEDHGFRVNRSAVYEGGVALELFEAELPEVEKHLGPPVWVGEHADSFLEKYGEAETFAGPWIDEDGRLVVERRREFTGAAELLDDLVERRKGFGKTLARRGGFRVNAGRAAAKQLPPGFLGRDLPWRRGE